MSETPEPTFEELRREAISSVYQLVNANQGVITPEAVLHLGMFFGETGKQHNAPRQPIDASAEDLYQQAHKVINRLDREEYLYGGYRLTIFSKGDAQILRNALQVLHDR
jgi:hypothetical protein